MSAPKKKPAINIKSLDGVRAICVSAVFIGHATDKDLIARIGVAAGRLHLNAHEVSALRRYS